MEEEKRDDLGTDVEAESVESDVVTGESQGQSQGYFIFYFCAFLFYLLYKLLLVYK